MMWSWKSCFENLCVFISKKISWNVTYWNEISLLILSLFSFIFFIMIKNRFFFNSKQNNVANANDFYFYTKWIKILINLSELYKNCSIHFWNFLISACLKRHKDYSKTCLNSFKIVIYLLFNSFKNWFFSIKVFSKWHQRLSCKLTLNVAWFWKFVRRRFLSWTLKDKIWILAKTYRSLSVYLSMNSRLISDIICMRNVDR
jgi:hypothetical protein